MKPNSRNRLIARDLHEADLGYPLVPGHTHVTLRMGGPALALCWLGFHVRYKVCLSSPTGSTDRDEWHCLRCGRVVATVRTRFDGQEDDEDEDEGGDEDAEPAGLDPDPTGRHAEW